MTSLGTLLLNVNANTTQFNSKMTGVTKLIGASGLAFAALGVAAIASFTVATKAAAGFEKGMSNISTLLDGDVSKRIIELGDDIKNLQKITGKSFEELQDGLYQTISAFGDTAESMDILQIATKAAVAGNSSVTDGINLLSSVMKGYNNVSAKSARVTSDLAFKAVKLGQTTFPELAASIGKVVPLSNELKISQEELFGVMATLTGVTGNTAEVATQYRGILTSLIKPAQSMTEALKQMGFESGKAAIESLGFQGVLDGLKESVNSDEVAFAELFGRVEAMTAALALTGSQAETFTEKTEEMTNAVGATAEAFSKQQANITATKDRIKQMFEVMKVNLGEKLLPVLNNFLLWFEKSLPKIQESTSTTFATIGKVMRPVVEFINASLMAAFKEIQDFWETYGPGITETVTKFFLKLQEYGERFSVFADERLMPVFKAFKQWMDDNLPTIKKMYNDTFQTMSDSLLRIWDSIDRLLLPILKEMGINLTDVDEWIKLLNLSLKLLEAQLWVLTRPLQAVAWLLEKIADLRDIISGDSSSLIGHSGGGSWGTGVISGQRANGGPVSAGRSYMVGENGPETFTPGTNGTIGKSSGSNITINVNGAGRPDAVAREIVRELARQGIKR